MYMATVSSRFTISKRKSMFLHFFMWFGAIFCIVGFAFALSESISDSSTKDALQKLFF